VGARSGRQLQGFPRESEDGGVINVVILTTSIINRSSIIISAIVFVFVFVVSFVSRTCASIPYSDVEGSNNRRRRNNEDEDADC